ncbi:hypothetical protein KPL74_10920 [Bacillus sp. NP157]|nr:hypothetical protein KPL74_10920 [Bacillus sp. NP157]
MLTTLAFFVALAPSSGAQTRGPEWTGQTVDVRGSVIAMDGTCRQLQLDDGRGRLWACYVDADKAPGMLARAHVHGMVRDTRCTRVGSQWWSIPVVAGVT